MQVEFLQTTGPLLGPAPNSHFYIESINFSKGDILLLYSDGITEATDSNSDQYEDERLVNKLKEVNSFSPKEIVLSILDDVINFSKNGIYNDDKTLVAIKKTK